jgi:hypothetical protein
MKRYTFEIHLTGRKTQTVTYTSTSELDASELVFSTLTDADKERVTFIDCTAIHESSESARLSDAAPDLLAALQRAREELAWFANEHQCCKLTDGVMDAIDNAIKKATQP